MSVAVDITDSLKTSLSGFNQGVLTGSIADATVSGANTFAVFRARVAAATGLTTEAAQAQQAVLRGLDMGFAGGILTNTNLNGLTTVASVRALFTAQDTRLATTYLASGPA